MNLRYFMTIGMLASGFFTAAFGFGYFFNIHSFVYYVVVQVSLNYNVYFLNNSLFRQFIFVDERETKVEP